MPSKIVITFTEKKESVETKISIETSGSELENEAAKILKQDVAELFYRILNESEQEEESIATELFSEEDEVKSVETERDRLTLTSCYKNYIKLCSDFGFALGSMKATLFYLLETYSGDDDTAKLRKDIMETTDKLRLAVTETQIFVENLLINIMRN